MHCAQIKTESSPFPVYSQRAVRSSKLTDDVFGDPTVLHLSAQIHTHLKEGTFQ